MTERLGDDLRVHTSREQRRRVRVPQVVQPHGGQSGSSHEPLERVREPVRVQVLTIAAIADEIELVPRGVEQQATLGLFLPVSAQTFRHERGQRDRAAAPIGLRCDERRRFAPRRLGTRSCPTGACGAGWRFRTTLRASGDDEPAA